MEPLSSSSPVRERPSAEFGGAADPRPEDVAIAAYFRAEARGFAPGNEVEDWLAAEREIASQLSAVRNWSIRR